MYINLFAYSNELKVLSSTLVKLVQLWSKNISGTIGQSGTYLVHKLL